MLPLVGDFQVGERAGRGRPCASPAGGDAAEAVFAALAHLKGAPGRLERIGEAHGALVFVDYAHKPDALEQVLEALRPFARGGSSCVFGCGGDRDRGKRPMMGAIAGELADVVIVTDDNPRSESPARDPRRDPGGRAGRAARSATAREAIGAAVAALAAGRRPAWSPARATRPARSSATAPCRSPTTRWCGRPSQEVRTDERAALDRRRTIAAATRARLTATMPARVPALSIDTRTLEPGDLFFAIGRRARRP